MKKSKIIRISQKNTLIILGGFAFLFIISFFALVLPAIKLSADAKVTYAHVKEVLAAVKQQNIAIAGEKIKTTTQSLTVLQNDLKGMGYVAYIPVLSGYYQDATHIAQAGAYGLDAGKTMVDSIQPYADVLGLKGQGSFVGGTAEQRIQTAVLAMGKITPRIDTLAKSLVLAKSEIDAIDPNHYPPFFGGDKLKKQLIQAKIITDQGVTFVNQARPLIKVLPSLLGETVDKRYLVLFQNDKELRPTGGFLTAYAIFKISKGKISIERSDDIYPLDNSIANKPKAPASLQKYFPTVPLFNLRDSNLSPDFLTSMKTFRAMYEMASQKVPVDGIIALDTHVLVSTIKVLDDNVSAGGIVFTTKTDVRCSCAQVIYVLEDNISRPVGYVREDRKGLLGSLLYAIMQKALASSPKLYWGPLVQVFIAEVNQKHVLFDLNDQSAQSGLAALNAVGNIEKFNGDYLHINDTNFGGDKANLFVSEEVENAYQVQSDGSIVKTVTIKYKNPYPASDCNLERGGLCLNADFRDWLRIYVPKGSELISNKGSQVKVTTYEELGKTVFDGFLVVHPQGIATYTISYKLPIKAQGSMLPLLIQKQPGTNENMYTIMVKGRTQSTFPLDTDKEVKISL